MKYEGQAILRPSIYHPERFKKQDKLLIEIIVESKKSIMKLYYISSIGALSLSKSGNLRFTDFKLGKKYSEDNSNTTINIYDSYSIETLRVDYEDIDARYNAIEKCIIYANGVALPAVKHHRKIKYPNPMGYEYSSVILKKEG